MRSERDAEDIYYSGSTFHCGKSGASQLSVTSQQVQTCPHRQHSSSRAKAQAASRRPITAKARVRSRVSPCGICGGTGTGFSPSTSVFLCQFHSTGPPLRGNTRKKTNHLHHWVAQGCGASVASAAGPLTTKKNTVINKVISLNVNKF